MTEAESEALVLWVFLVQQYNLKKGLKLFGTRAEEAVEKELAADSRVGRVHAQDGIKVKMERRQGAERW